MHLALRDTPSGSCNAYDLSARSGCLWPRPVRRWYPATRSSALLPLRTIIQESTLYSCEQCYHNGPSGSWYDAQGSRDVPDMPVVLGPIGSCLRHRCEKRCSQLRRCEQRRVRKREHELHDPTRPTTQLPHVPYTTPYACEVRQRAPQPWVRGGIYGHDWVGQSTRDLYQKPQRSPRRAVVSGSGRGSPKKTRPTDVKTTE